MTRTLNDVIDDIGMGWCQARIVTIAGGVWFCAGELNFLMAASYRTISKEHGLNAYQRAMLATSVFMGMLVGNWLSLTSDGLGRRPPIRWCLVVQIVFGICLTLATSAKQIACVFAIIGLAGGFAVPSLNSILSECCPKKDRLFLAALGQTVYVLGVLAAALLVYLHSPDLEMGPHWRQCVLMACIPNLFFVVLAYAPGFVESPHFLLLQGRRDEAIMNLAEMSEQNGVPEVSLAFDDPQNEVTFGIVKSLKLMFSRRFFCTTVVVCLTAFMINFVSYGSMYALPVVLRSVKLGMSPALGLVLVNAAELLGFPVGVMLGHVEWIGRRVLLIIYLFGSALSAGAFVWGAWLLEDDSSSTLGFVLVHSGVDIGKFWIAIGWLVTYVYLGEIFPTVIRASAAGACMGFGRFGSMSAPWAFEVLHEQTGDFSAFFSLQAAMCATNALLVWLVLQETKGENLQACGALNSKSM